MELKTYNDNMAHLQAELLVLNLRLHRQVLRWRATHHSNATPEEMLGLHISDKEVDAILDGLYASRATLTSDAMDKAPIATLSTLLEEAEEHHAECEANALAEGVRLYLPEFVQRLNLTAFERSVVLLAFAPEFDRRYERLFGYLNDDVTRRLATVDLALQVLCIGPDDRARERQSFHRDRVLRAYRLIHVDTESGASRSSLLSSPLKLDEHVVSYLLGDDRRDPNLEHLLHVHDGGPADVVMASDFVEEMVSLEFYVKARPTPAPTIIINGSDVELQVAAAARLAKADDLSTSLVVLNGADLSTRNNAEDIAFRALRQARLMRASLAVRGADSLRGTVALRTLIDSDRDYPLYLLTSDSSSIETKGSPQVTLRLPSLGFEERRLVWSASLNGQSTEPDVTELSDRFRLSSAQIAEAASQAYVHAAAFGGGLPDRAGLFASSRVQSTNSLQNLAQHVETIHSWNDLVVPSKTKHQLLSLENWVVHRHVVYDAWGYSQRVMLGKGLVVLFSGGSGTGKTMAAGILSRNLELDMYRIDLSTVVSKYVGETEKNLSQIFESAESANAILFFDEADSIFGKRSEVKDAHDRYANIEVSYLLQRMESYDGIAILATNFRQNLDTAFARRMHVVIEFPLPSVTDRERIWRQLLPGTVPQSDDIDLSYLARQFGLTGGNIKNCVLTAAFSAAPEGGPISMQHLVQAVARELDKIEQPIVRSDFGSYYDLIQT